MTIPGHGERWTDTARGYLSRTAPVVPPIYQCTTFELDDQSYEDIVQGGGFEQTWYTRFGNPTVAWAADRVARLEGGQAAVMTSSGMGAIATALLSLCRAGDRIVAARELYGDTRDLLVRDLPALGIRVDFVATADLAHWEAALAAGPAAVAYAESLSNPQLRVLDIPAVAELVHRRGVRLVVDNTFASAFTVQPLSLGADVVVHSATKFLNGHSDVVAGAVVADAASIREVQRRVVTFGTCLDPHAAFLVPGRCTPTSYASAGKPRPQPASPAGWRARQRSSRSAIRGWRPTRTRPWLNEPGGLGVGGRWSPSSSAAATTARPSSCVPSTSSARRPAWAASRR
jgi:cystathionine beta-lyase/cystathionine gamma-synthase